MIIALQWFAHNIRTTEWQEWLKVNLQDFNIELPILQQPPGPCFNIKTVFPGMGIPIIRIRKSLHSVVTLFYIYNRNTYAVETTTSSHWDGPLVAWQIQWENKLSTLGIPFALWNGIVNWWDTISNIISKVELLDVCWLHRFTQLTMAPKCMYQVYFVI